MPTETTARAQPPQPGAPEETDYHAFHTALSASERGRAFLAEYARRNSHADTKPLLSALERLQTSLNADMATPAETRVRQKLRALLDDIATAQNEIEASVMAIRTARLADLLAMVERRIAAIMAPVEPDSAPPKPEQEPAPRLFEEPGDETRARLAVVPPSDQPELPIPSPPAALPPPIALVRTDNVMAEVAFAGPQPAAVEDATGVTPAADPSPARAAAELPPADPLASIMALSEEERIAMFT
jgi:hypothetical protein